MKYRTFSKWILGASLMSFPVAASPVPGAAASEAAPLPASALAAEQPSAVEDSALELAGSADSDAPAKPISVEKTLPPNIKPSGPVAEVIKLANSGVAESVMLAYVTNSTHTFNLGAEEIIYLNDIGVPGSVVTAMIQQDQILKASLAAAASGPPAALQPPEPPGNGQFPATMPGFDQSTMPPAETAPGYATEAPLTPPGEPSDSMFYDSLAPYGNWVDVQGYGRCWQPNVVVVNNGWQPYFDCGHWVYSDCGWYWLSDYSWGWAPFHYGSWFRHAHLGWCWVPGKVWAPSWVSWRYNNDYCGWAPLPPGVGFTAGVGLTFRGHGVWDRDDLGLRPGHYHFVAWNHFPDRELRPHRLPPHDFARVYNTSTVATRIIGDGHTVINNGLPPSRVVAATRRPIHTVALREVSNPAMSGRTEHFEAGGETLAIYRPSPTAIRSHSPSQNPGQIAGTPGQPAPWTARGTVTRKSVTELRQDNPPAGPTASLILRGEQSSASRENPPPNSLVVIGRRNAGRSETSARPWPSAPSADRAASAPSADRAASALSAPRSQTAAPDFDQNSRVQNVARRPATPQNPQKNWMGMVSSSPQPSWFGGNEAGPARQANGGAVSPPEPRTYQSVPRTASPEVPRYAPAPTTPRYAPTPTYVPQRSYSAPAPAPSVPARSPSFETRPAPSIPSAPSAPAATSHSAPSTPSAPSQSSSRNSR